MAGVPTTGELSIVIQMPENAGGQTSKGTPTPGAPQDESNPSTNPVSGSKNGQAKLALAVSAAKSIGMQSLNAAVSTIGIATGNYYMQSKVERGLQAATDIVGMGVAFMANPVLGAVSLAMKGIQSHAEMYKQNKEREIANYQAEQYAKRIGYTVDRR